MSAQVRHKRAVAAHEHRADLALKAFVALAAATALRVPQVVRLQVDGLEEPAGANAAAMLEVLVVALCGMDGVHLRLVRNEPFQAAEGVRARGTEIANVEEMLVVALARPFLGQVRIGEVVALVRAVAFLLVSLQVAALGERLSTARLPADEWALAGLIG